jgi:hypothetical protein
MTVRNSRRGVALIWALAILSLLGVMSALTAKQFAAARRLLDSRYHRIQADWLTRSGAELAAARLIGEENYTGETIEIVPGGPVRIVVTKDSGTPGRYRVRCDVAYPAGDFRAAKAVLTRTATRRTEGGKVTVALAAESGEPPGP